MILKDYKLRRAVLNNFTNKSCKPFILAASEGHIGGGYSM